MNEGQASISITTDTGHWSGLEVRRTEVCLACQQRRESTPTQVKFIVFGKVVTEETSFPVLHGTLVKAGGHLIQRTEECEARHKH